MNYLFDRFWSLFYDLGALLCHQIESRCLMLSQTPLPVCARCTGIYLGVLTVFIWLMIRYGRRNRIPLSRSFFGLLGILTAFMLADAATGITDDFNLWRFVSGYGFGFVCFAGVLSLYHKWMIRPEQITTQSFPWLSFTVLLTVSVSGYLSMIYFLNDYKMIYLLLSVGLFAGIMILYIYINMFIYIFVFFREIRFRIGGPLCYIGALSAGFLLFIVELLILSWLEIKV